LNPYNLPEIKKEDFMTDMELIARGCFTKNSTLISRSYSEQMYQLLKQKGCLLKQGDGDIDSLKLQKNLEDGTIKIEFFNNQFKQENDDIDLFADLY
jgi:hypothetical protein